MATGVAVSDTAGRQRPPRQDPKGTEMTNEERDMITQFITRVGGAPAGGQANLLGGSVPATTQPPLPPVDPEANALITQTFQRYPEAGYRCAEQYN